MSIWNMCRGRPLLVIDFLLKSPKCHLIWCHWYAKVGGWVGGRLGGRAGGSLRVGALVGAWGELAGGGECARGWVRLGCQGTRAHTLHAYTRTRVRARAQPQTRNTKINILHAHVRTCLGTERNM